jgi:hypothetical protein
MGTREGVLARVRNNPQSLLREREVLWRLEPRVTQPIQIVLPFRRGLRPAWMLPWNAGKPAAEGASRWSAVDAGRRSAVTETPSPRYTSSPVLICSLVHGTAATDRGSK